MGSHQEVELRFSYGGASARELQAAIDAILAEDSDDASSDVSVRVSEEGQGVEPVTTIIVITIAVRGVEKVAADVWSDVLWPKLRKRLGVDSVGSEVD